jgi:hypothetical protein
MAARRLNVKTFPSPTKEQVALARKLADVSPTAAAACIGVTARMWGYYEEGKHEMNGRLFLSFCTRFDLIKPDL